MKQNTSSKSSTSSKLSTSSKSSMRFHRMAIAIAASGAMAATAAHASSGDKIMFVPPTDLPGMARQNGDAMFLHETSAGRTLLYIEQDQGARLATFDVTDPAHIKGEGSVQLRVSGPFDFVSPLGGKAELIRFRGGHEDAVLDLSKEKLPQLEPWRDIQVAEIGNVNANVSANANANAYALSYVDVKQGREEVTNAETGTTFKLTENGLFIIRRPDVEREKKQREQEWFWQHTGG
jgi:hypothetical protein